MSDEQFEHTRRRNDDHETAKQGAKHVSKSAPNLRTRLLAAYIEAGSDGLTDEEAAERIGVLDTCYWKRCNELRQLALIMPTTRARAGRKGVKRMVSVVTGVGRNTVTA